MTEKEERLETLTQAIEEARMELEVEEDDNRVLIVTQEIEETSIELETLKEQLEGQKQSQVELAALVEEG